MSSGPDAQAETQSAAEATTTEAPTAVTPSEVPAAPTTHETEGETSGAAPASPTSAERAPTADLIEISEFAVFTTPAQAAYCLISAPSDGMAASISCEVGQSSVPPGDPLVGMCDSEGFGWYFNFFADSGHSGFSCNHHDGITTGGGNPHYWQDDPWINPDNVVTLPSGALVAILDYGRVMRAGDMECSVQPDGLTCRAAGSGHGFTVNTASYTSW